LVIATVSRTYSRCSRLYRAAVVALLVATAPVALSQTYRPTPEGLPAGRWFLAPYAFVGVEADDNIFRRPEESGQVEPDQIVRTTLGLLATLPVRNNGLSIEYTADRFAYQNNPLPRDWTQDFRADWLMDLSSGDRVRVAGRYNLGLTNVQTVDPGGELTFNGNPFTLARVDFEVGREIRRRPGYEVRVSRIELRWDYEPGDPELRFFDYDGWDATAEYRQPTAAIDWMTVYVGARRFDNYLPFERELGPYRREESESLQVGARGMLGREQPFLARIGYGRFRYSGRIPSLSTFRGLVGDVQWRLRVGGRSHVGLRLNRRPLPSVYQTYYIVSELRVRVDREWLQYSRAGIDLLVGLNKYGDPIPAFDNCGGGVRKDKRLEAEAFMDWLFHRKIGFRVGVGHYERSSNCPLSNFTANAVTTGLTLGWF
jgi:hypothetical protein